MKRGGERVNGGKFRSDGLKRHSQPVSDQLPGLKYLDDRPFAEGGFATVYRGAYTSERGSIAVVGWCRLTVSTPMLKAPMVSALEATI